MTTFEIMKKAKETAPSVSLLSSEQKNAALHAMADALLANMADILRANDEDVAAAQGIISDVMIDRLRLTKSRINAMAEGIRAVCKLPDPVGRVLSTAVRDDGLLIEKISVPMGVVAIIYESRPNVTSDAVALALKSGNACILRGGKEAFRSSCAIVGALREGLSDAGVSPDAVLIVQDVSRQSAKELMTGVGYIDLLIPRGGAGLIRACVEQATVPCIQTGTGICHLYVDRDADMDKALNIVENAKTSRPSVCNAAEVCLVHRDVADQFLPRLFDRLVEKRKDAGLSPVTLKLDEASLKIIAGTPAGENDFDTEFLDYILAVGIVDGVDDAARHINAHGTGHSEAIVTENNEAANRFSALVDCAAVYINASTRFTDGGEFGLGCEMGISTQKLHARGPLGLSELNTYKYVVRGNGHVR